MEQTIRIDHEAERKEMLEALEEAHEGTTNYCGVFKAEPHDVLGNLERIHRAKTEAVDANVKCRNDVKELQKLVHDMGKRIDELEWKVGAR